MNQYTYRAEYSPEYGEYVGVCLEYPFRYSRAPTAHQAIEGVERMIDRQYSGNLRVRPSPSLHSRLAVEAHEQGVSLNQWVVQKLADRKTIPSLDDLL
jgi:hypothetical protein